MTSASRARRAAGWTAVAVVAGVLVAGAVSVAGAVASAQTMDVQRPRTLAVGAPAVGVRVDRVDAARTGRSRTVLPAGGVRVEWKTPLGVAVDAPPLVDGAGNIVVVGTRGEVVSLAGDGSERWRLSTGAIQPGPGALLSDGTLVFVDAAGEAVAVRDGAVRWRVHFGRGDAAHPAPVPTDDGGIVVATTRDLALLDADGHERARTTLPESTTVPLVAALGKIVAITTSGVVWTWSPGAVEPARVGSFGGPVDDGAGLADDHTLIAVTAGHAHLSALDLVRGTTSTRAVVPAGLWLGPPTLLGDTVFLALLGPTTELAVGIDGAGNDVLRAPIATRLAPLVPLADGGAPPLVALPHTPSIVDSSGTLAFATTDGTIGVVNGGVVSTLPDACAAAPGPRGAAAPTAGLAPSRPGAFVAACRAGTLLSFRGLAATGDPATPHL
jgi:hypothetical protein